MDPETARAGNERIAGSTAAGEGFLDTGIHPHMARNETGLSALNVVTYLVAPGTTALRSNTAPPSSCPL